MTVKVETSVDKSLLSLCSLAFIGLTYIRSLAKKLSRSDLFQHHILDGVHLHESKREDASTVIYCHRVSTSERSLLKPFLYQRKEVTDTIFIRAQGMY